jgi:ATP-dependent DNA ligase
MNKLYDTLYTIDSTGKTRVWRQEQQGNKYRTIAGVKGSDNMVTSEWTLCEGKNVGKANATSGESQAEAEVLAKYKKQLKTGYAKSEKDASKGTSYVEPMLAKELNDYITKIDFSKGVLVQNKYNGARCVATLEDGKVVLKSRKGELWVSVPHINKDLEKFFKNYPNAVLDGELYNYDLREKLNELMKLVRKTKDITAEELRKSEQMVRFYVYDGYGTDVKTLNQEVDYVIRKAWIDEVLPDYSTYYRQVKTTLVRSMKEVDKLYGTFLADGEEGAIIRMPHSPYENKRSKFLLKYKPVDDDEAVIVELIEGTGNWSKTAKTATLKWKGMTFDATFLKSYELGVERLKNKKDWVGKTVTFLYTGLTGLGTPNYARIDPENCFKNDR